jgi:predicted CoA-binding protein
VGGVLIMVKAVDAVAIVRACLAADVKHVWLYKGVGGPGALSEEAVELCRAGGIEVVEGACPLMFLEPVGVIHRIHRRLRRLNGSLAKAA